MEVPNINRFNDLQRFKNHQCVLQEMGVIDLFSISVFGPPSHRWFWKKRTSKGRKNEKRATYDFEPFEVTTAEANHVLLPSLSAPTAGGIDGCKKE